MMKQYDWLWHLVFWPCLGFLFLSVVTAPRAELKIREPKWIKEFLEKSESQLNTYRKQHPT